MSTLSATTQDAILACFREVVPDPDWRLILFGSFANGAADRASDIDLALDGPRPLPAATLARLQAALEERVPTVRSFDLVDLRTAPDALTQKVTKEGVPWPR